MQRNEFVPLIFASSPELANACDQRPGPHDNAVAWIDGHGSVPKAHVLALDAQDRVRAACRIPLGGAVLAVRAGARIARSPEALTLTGAALVIGGVDIPADIDIGLHDGALTFAAQAPAEALDAELRYFFARPSGPGALRYPVFKARTGGRMQVTGRFDPARPGDARNGLTLAAAAGDAPLETNFRTTLGRAITLTPIAGRAQIGYQYDPTEAAFYPAPMGDWALGQDGPACGPEMNMLLGLSGLEHSRIDAAGMLRFVPGAPAYAPGFGGTGPQAAGLTAACPGAAYPVTTPWIYPLERENAPAPTGAPRGYYAQPDNAAYYTPGDAGVFQDLLAAPASGFPPPADMAQGGAVGVLGAPAAAFPAVPYAGLAPGAEPFGTYRAFETDILSPLRFAAIAAINRNAAPAGPGEAKDGPAAGAMGLLAAIGADPARPDRLALGAQGLQLTAVDDVLHAALTRNQLFLVISDPEALMRHASVRYAVTAATAAALVAPPEGVAAGLKTLAARGPCETLAQFAPAARAALGADHDRTDPASGLTWGALLLRAAAQASLTVAGWTFDVSPHRWGAAGDADATIMVLKFADRSLQDLAATPDAWTMAETFNPSPDDARARLLRIIETARDDAAGGEADFNHFAGTVAGDPSWNGVLFLNACVPADGFPPQVRALAAGIAGPDLRAHHVGIDLPRIAAQDGRAASPGGAAFGVIRHVDPQHLAFRGDPHDFKLLSLKIRFANGRVASFSSRIEVLIAALFGEPASLLGAGLGAGRGGIILDGALQRHGAVDSYHFSHDGPSVFGMDSRVLHDVTITGAQLVTDAPQPGRGGRVSARLALRGALRFRALDGFDPFSFGPGAESGAGLAFCDMHVAMDFARADPADRRFAFAAGQMAFDASADAARAGSLFRRFAPAVTGMVQGRAGTGPRDMGFAEVTTPLGTGALGPEWYGLAMDLGSCGANTSGRAPVRATLLACWAPDAQKANVALGLRLSGPDGGSRPVAGPARIDIAAVEMMLSRAGGSYLVRMRSLAREFLGGRVPPGARAEPPRPGDSDAKSAAPGGHGAGRKGP